MGFCVKWITGNFTQTEQRALEHTFNLIVYLDASKPFKRKITRKNVKEMF